ncbi:MAG: hypothetical protein NT076_03055, partial [Candidatus Pacearchaeota archaeon]|nr:hypothetical protein [Candidatus Pacearchaeota archaeon]
MSIKLFSIGIVLMNISLIILLLIIGWFGNDLYRNINDKRTVEGLWFGNPITKEKAIETADKIDGVGRWICVNIVPEMKYQELVNTCEHE